jgi:hypothetical protein
MADMLRIRWPPWFGINGRLAPDYAPKIIENLAYGLSNSH